jgi:3-methylfumaryl-CoA hydratase
MNDVRAGLVGAEELEAWRTHIGRRETRRQILDVESLRRYAAAVGSPLNVERVLPPLAHWAWFLDTVAAEGLGPDGHPKRGGLIPAIPLPRRMFAAAEMRFRRPLLLGSAAELSVTVADVRHRRGKAGDLVFVDLDRRLRQEDDERLVERQTIVYRAAGEPVAPVTPGATPPAGDVWTPGPVDLFRFSAATFNAHRIHYDLPYAREVEGYPGLVVHGPFTAARLFAHARDRTGGAIAAFAFRIAAPLFAGQPIGFSRGSASGEWVATRCDGVIATTARLNHVGVDDQDG